MNRQHYPEDLHLSIKSHKHSFYPNQILYLLNPSHTQQAQAVIVSIDSQFYDQYNHHFHKEKSHYHYTGTCTYNSHLCTFKLTRTQYKYANYISQSPQWGYRIIISHPNSPDPNNPQKPIKMVIKEFIVSHAQQL
jgi:hypothetical protein